MATNTTKPILISGAGIASLLFAQSLRRAGIASLLFAQSLRRAGIPFLIFERDSSMTFRAQGYRLLLRAEGLEAIEAALEPAGFQTFWDTCGKTGGSGAVGLDAVTGEKVVDPVLQAHQKKAAEAKQPPKPISGADGRLVGIARGDMRRLFMTGCEPFVHWAHNVVGYEVTSSGVYAVFADGSKSVEGEMLIAGDGIYSKVAKQLSQGALKVYDTGSRGIHGQAPTTAYKALGEGVWRMVDNTNPRGKLFAITNVRSGDMDDPNIKFGWTMGAQAGVIRPPNDDYAIIGKPAADIAKALTANWHPRIKPLFDETDEAEAAFWKITCSTPTGVPEWQNEPRVTVIGDAVHGMTPAGGMGANTALRDSALLGKLVSEAGGYKDGITAAFEREMRVYASEAVRMSYGLSVAQFGTHIDENTPTV